MAPTGRPRKPAERRQATEKARNAVVSLALSRPSSVPKPPSGLLRSSREVWEAYWSDDVSRVANSIDVESVRRLIIYRDEWVRLMAAYRRTRFVVGSTRQLKVNPALDKAMTIEGLIVRLATELGLTPYARMKLGIAVGQATKTLDELKRDAERGDQDEDEGGEPDPRLAALDLPAQDL